MIYSHKWAKIGTCCLALTLTACSTSSDNGPRAPSSQELTPPFEVDIAQPHNVQVIETGVAAFEKRLEMIDRAQSSIDIEYFIYSIDHAGRIFTQALIKKKKENPQIEIHLLVDASSLVLQLAPEYVNEMTRQGIEVKYYNLNATWQVISLQYRDHRKLLLTDGREAITGGRNIADEYFDLHEQFNFRDRDIWVEGPVVADMKKSFDAYWNDSHAEKVEAFKAPNRADYHDFPRRPRQEVFPTPQADKYRRDLAAYNKKHAAAVAYVTETDDDRAIRADVARVAAPLLADERSKGICPRVHSVTDEPGFDFGLNKFSSRRHVRDALAARASAIHNQHIFVESPYFIAEEKAQRALIETSRNGDEITILTNGLPSTDAFYVAADFLPRTVLYKLEGAGKIYAYSGQAQPNISYVKSLDGTELAKKALWGLHAKTIVFGNEAFSIGTFNIDPRSANLNAEMVLICEGNTALTDYVRDQIQARIDLSLELNEQGLPINGGTFKDSDLTKKILFIFSVPASSVFEFLL